MTPERYVDAEEVEDDGEPFDEKMTESVVEDAALEWFGELGYSRRSVLSEYYS